MRKTLPATSPRPTPKATPYLSAAWTTSLVLSKPSGTYDGADRLGVEVGRLGAELQAPGGDGAADALGEPVVAGEDVVEPLLLDHLQRFAEAEEQLHRRRVGVAALRVGAEHVAEVEEAARQLRGLHRLQRLRADADDREAGREHEALLAAGDGDVDAPLVHAEVHRADRADAVDEEERRVLGRVHRLADGGDVGADAGRGLVVGDEDGLDLVVLVGLERGLELGRRARRRPRGR